MIRLAWIVIAAPTYVLSPAYRYGGITTAAVICPIEVGAVELGFLQTFVDLIVDKAEPGGFVKDKERQVICFTHLP
jgi:hypothetical protein